MGCSMSFDIPDARLRGKGLSFLMGGFDDSIREWIKSLFVDILHQFLEFLFHYAFSCLCNDSCACYDSWPVGEDGCGHDLHSVHLGAFRLYTRCFKYDRNKL